MVEAIVAFVLTALLIGMAMAMYSWLRRGNWETMARNVCSGNMRLLHELLRRDVVSAGGWRLEGGSTLHLDGVVDAQGRPVNDLSYVFKTEERRVIRRVGAEEKTTSFAEGTTGFLTFRFYLTFADERGHMGIAPEKAKTLTVELIISDEKIGSQNFTFLVTRKSSFSSEVPSQDLTWE